MNGGRQRSPILAPAVALLLVATGAAAQPNDTDRSELLRRAAEARAAGNHEAAVAEAQRAYRQQRTSSVARFIAEEWLQLEHAPRAWTFVGECLALVRAEPPSKNRDAVLEGCTYLADQLQRELVFIEVVNPLFPAEPFFELTGPTAVRDGAVFVALPGTHRIEARLPGYRTFARDLELEAGQRVSVELQLLPRTPVTPARASLPPPLPARAPPPLPPKPRKSVEADEGLRAPGAGPVALWVVAGLAATGAVLFKLSADSRFDDLRRECRTDCPADETQRRDDIESRDAAALGLGIVSALSAAGGVAWWLADDAARTEPGPRLGASASRSGVFAAVWAPF